jgi:hypothetical protein
MNNESSRNEGVTNIAEFDDKAIPLSEAAEKNQSARHATRSVNEAIHPLAEFSDRAQPLNSGTNGAVDPNGHSNKDQPADQKSDLPDPEKS